MRNFVVRYLETRSISPTYRNNTYCPLRFKCTYLTSQVDRFSSKKNDIDLLLEFWFGQCVGCFFKVSYPSLIRSPPRTFKLSLAYLFFGNLCRLLTPTWDRSFRLHVQRHQCLVRQNDIKLATSTFEKHGHIIIHQEGNGFLKQG